MITIGHALVGGAAFIAASAIVAFIVGRALGIAEERDRQRRGASELCCGSGHPESGDDDLLDVGVAVLEPRTAEMLVSRPALAPATRPLAAVRSTFEARA